MESERRKSRKSKDCLPDRSCIVFGRERPVELTLGRKNARVTVLVSHFYTFGMA